MEEKILNELKSINVKLQETEERITATFRGEIAEAGETLRREIQETKEKITTTLRKEIDQRIGQSTTEISNEIKDLCNVIEKKENENQDKIRKELRQHENKVLKGVEALKKVLVS